MNAKYALALILALQVSMSLCEVHEPSPELVAKYNSMKTTFIKRLVNLFSKAQQAAVPLMEKFSTPETEQGAKDFIEELQAKPEFQAFVKVASGVGQEAGPLVDRARTLLLGAYEQHLRPRIGQHLNDAIEGIKVYLDKYMPAE